MPVRLRLFMMSLGGLALLAAGEIVYRRINHISAAGLFGAGVAVLFVISYAGNVYYAAYDYQTAFIFALATTVIGSAVAMRGRLVSIAVLAQIGGHIAPIVLSTGQPPGVALLAYVLTLQIVALVLAMWGRTPKWWILRAVSLAPTACWVVVCLLQGHWGAGLANEVLWFTVVYAAAYQGELLRSALLAGEQQDQRSQPPTAGFGSIFSLLVTAGLTAVVLYIFYDYDSRLLRGGSTLTLAALTLAGGLLLRSSENPLVDALKISYRVQGLALIVLFVPVTFTGVWISLAWGVLSLAFAALGARFDRPLARSAALCTWLLALIRLLIDIADAEYGGAAGHIWLNLLGHPTKGYTVLAWLLAAAGLGIGWLTQARYPLRTQPPAVHWSWAGMGATILATILWWIASLAGLPALGATLALVI